MALWVARAGRHGERESYALDNNVVVFGSEDIADISNIGDRDQLLELLLATYPDENPKKVKNWEAQLWAFVQRFQKNDIVALPLKTQSAIAFGRIVGDYRYVSDAPLGAQHQRPVEWINTAIPRSKLDSDLRYSFGGALAVFGVYRNNAEARIRALLGGKPSSPPFASTDERQEEDEVVATVDVQQQADDQIVDFIGRKFKGHNLTHLVGGVLEAQDYTIRISPPGADGGVDIVAGRGPMGFEAPRLCVQVKSGDDPIDVTVMRELQGVMKNYRAEQGLIVSWGGFKTTVLREARQLFFEIRLWDQSDLLRNIQETYERLPDQLQAELPMKRSWVLVVEEM